MMRYINIDRSPCSGVSIAEMLVVLATLAFIAAALASNVRPHSDRLVTQHQIANLAERLAESRFEAVNSSDIIFVNDFAEPCEGGNAELTLYPDGTAIGGPYCFKDTSPSTIIYIDPLTGHVLLQASE